MRVLTSEIANLAAGNSGAEVELKGWIHRIRELGGLTFLVLRDRAGTCQLVVEGKVDVNLESVVSAVGIPIPNEKAPGGAELHLRSLAVLSSAAPDLPYPVNGDPTKMGLDVVLENRTLSLRNPRIRAIFKLQSTIVEAFSEYLRAQDFTEIKTSKLIGSGTEGGTGLFEVGYFERKVYLAQSPQFYKQILVASGLERVFEVAPAYRAEKHDTPRHLNEYVSMDVELGFIDTELDLIELEKGLLAHIFEQAARKNRAELELWGASLPDAAAVFRAPTVSHDEALRLAAEEAAFLGIKGGTSGRHFEISPEVERLLCSWSLRERGIDLVFVNEFPRRHRPFYTYPLDASRTMSFDALFRGLEITTGGRRQHDYTALLEALPKFGLRAEDLASYLAVFKYGCPPHGGFAIGCERLTQKILGLSSVKEASLFPRDRKRVTP